MSLADCLENVGAGCGESHAGAGLCEINNCQSNHEGGCGDDLEIDQRLNSHAPYLPERTGARDSHHNGGEYKRRDDRLDQFNENVAQKINRIAPIGPQPSNHATDKQPDHDLYRQRWAIPRPTPRLNSADGHGPSYYHNGRIRTARV